MKTTKAKKIADNKIVGKLEIKLKPPRVKRGGVHKSKKRYSRKNNKSID